MSEKAVCCVRDSYVIGYVEGGDGKKWLVKRTGEPRVTTQDDLPKLFVPSRIPRMHSIPREGDDIAACCDSECIYTTPMTIVRDDLTNEKRRVFS